MKIILNNIPENIDSEKLSIQELLDFKNFSFKMLVVRLNGQLIKKSSYESTYITEGDHVVVLHLISGG